MRNVSTHLQSAPAPRRRVQFKLGEEFFHIYSGRPARIQPNKPSGYCTHCKEDRQLHRVNETCGVCGNYVSMKPNVPGLDGAYCLRRYPRIVAHMISESLGYFTPSSAAQALSDAITCQRSFSEMMAHCYKGDARKMVIATIQRRHYHTGYMAHYPEALTITAMALANLGEPAFASWF